MADQRKRELGAHWRKLGAKRFETQVGHWSALLIFELAQAMVRAIGRLNQAAKLGGEAIERPVMANRYPGQDRDLVFDRSEARQNALELSSQKLKGDSIGHRSALLFREYEDRCSRRQDRE
jgi:hypothetical protein